MWCIFTVYMRLLICMLKICVAVISMFHIFILELLCFLFLHIKILETINLIFLQTCGPIVRTITVNLQEHYCFKSAVELLMTNHTAFMSTAVWLVEWSLKRGSTILLFYHWCDTSSLKTLSGQQTEQKCDQKEMQSKKEAYMYEQFIQVHVYKLILTCVLMYRHDFHHFTNYDPDHTSLLLLNL